MNQQKRCYNEDRIGISDINGILNEDRIGISDTNGILNGIYKEGFAIIYISFVAVLIMEISGI